MFYSLENKTFTLTRCFLLFTRYLLLITSYSSSVFLYSLRVTVYFLLVAFFASFFLIFNVTLLVVIAIVCWIFVCLAMSSRPKRYNYFYSTWKEQSHMKNLIKTYQQSQMVHLLYSLMHYWNIVYIIPPCYILFHNR